MRTAGRVRRARHLNLWQANVSAKEQNAGSRSNDQEGLVQ